MCQPSTPEKTTTVTDLPDWAKGYAKDTLAKGAALTDISQNPYQQYRGERIAGFQPLQEQTFQTAAGMQPSSQLGYATGLAGAAGFGALGTNYQAGRFSGGQFGNRQAAQYMSPFIEQAMQPQLREAERASQIQGTQQRAQAVQAGAFGGSRQGIMEAERERNLGIQQGDIRAKGYQTAYEQAANQFNQDMARRMQAQQMGEQSRQYGAGLGMQGLQTGLQAAGQLGQLGQTEYGQRMGITQLQSQLGTQQQQQAQRPLDVAYQDFLNQQNYPYKQLGFMSDMIRGLPLGQQSTAQIYGGSGNTMGQLAGIGTGIYGLSRMGMFDSPTPGKAEGGEIKSYAGNEGSVTSQGNKDAIVDDMYSIEALQRAKEFALNRRDMDTVAAIDERIAELNAIRAQSASLNYGLGSAFDQIPQDQQEQIMRGANGGIVAFADGDMVSENKTSRFGQSGLGRLLNVISPPDAQQQEAERLRKYNEFISASQAQPGFFESVSPEELAKSEKQVQKAATQLTTTRETLKKEADLKNLRANRPPVKGAGARTAPSSIAKDTREEKPAPKQKKLSPTIDKAITKMAEDQGVPKDEFMDTFDKMFAKLQTESKEDLKGLQDLIDKQSGKSKEIKEKALGKALAEFGFNMAAQASKTGRESKGQGLAGLLGSAAAASPILAASAAESEKLAAAADENDIKMQIEMRKYNIAARKNDSATAMQHAQNMRQLQQNQQMIRQQQRQLDETIRHNIRTENLMGARINASGNAYNTAVMRTKSNIAINAQKQAAKDWADPMKKIELMKQYPSQKTYAESLYKDMWLQTMPQLELIGTKSAEE